MRREMRGEPRSECAARLGRVLSRSLRTLVRPLRAGRRVGGHRADGGLGGADLALQPACSAASLLCSTFLLSSKFKRAFSSFISIFLSTFFFFFSTFFMIFYMFDSFLLERRTCGGHLSEDAAGTVERHRRLAHGLSE